MKSRVVLYIDGVPKLVDMAVPDKQLNMPGRQLEGYTFHATCGFKHVLTVMLNGNPGGFVSLETEQ
jgi:hypothetical protein